MTDRTSGKIQAKAAKAGEPAADGKPLTEKAAAVAETVCLSTESRTVTRGVQRVGPFEILGEIARGGMGVVYRARQVGVNRVVALKMTLSSQGMTEEERVRFQAEAEAAGQLNHPNIVPVYAVGDDAGCPYIAMGFIEGQSLREQLAEGPLSAQKSAELVKTIAAAVHYAHTQGIVHRDLKPANVLIDQQGHPQVTDFGLAKRTTADSGLTTTGQILGTPSYMPPEQAMGRIADVGVASDVYSLGATLYCLLTGRPPFQAASVMDTLMQVIHQDPVPLRQLNPRIPQDLETICLKCLSKNPDERYASAKDLHNELDRFLRNEPILARPIGSVERTWRWAKRQPAQAGLLAVSLLALVAVAIVGASLSYQGRLTQSLAETEVQRKLAEEQSHTANQQRVLAETERERADSLREKAEALQKNAEALRVEAEQEREIAVVASQEAKQQRQRAEFQEARAQRLLYGARVQVADQYWDDGALSAMGSVLDSLRPTANDPDPRGFEWHYLERLRRHGFDYQRLPNHPNLQGLALSPDNRFLASCGGRRVRVWELDAGKEVWNHPIGVDTKCVLWNSTGERLYVGTSGAEIQVWDMAGSKVQTAKVLSAQATVFHMARTHDDRLLALHFANHRVAVVNAADLSLVRTWPVSGLAGDGSGLAFSLDEQSVYTAAPFDARVRVWRISDGKEQAPLPGEFDGLGIIYRRPDSQYLAVAGLPTAQRGARGVLWDLEKLSEPRAFEGHRIRIEDLSLTSDGRTLITAGADSTVRVWDVARQVDTQVFRGHENSVAQVVASADGQRVISGGVDGSLLSWNRSSNARSRVIRHDSWVFRVHFDSGGQRIATAAKDGSVRVFNASNGKLLRTFTGHAQQAEDVAFSPDGTRLYSSSNDATIRVWDLTGNAEPTIWTGHTGPIWTIAVSPDGKWLVSASHDGSVRLWETASGECRNVWKEHMAEVHTVTWDSKHEIVLSASIDGKVLAWRPLKDRALWGFQARGVNGIAVSPDGQYIATSSMGLVELWDFDSHRRLREFRGPPNSVYAVAFSPQGNRLASAGVDDHIRLWDPETGQQLLRLQHDATIFGISFSPDGRRLASASRDETVRIWDSLDP